MQRDAEKMLLENIAIRLGNNSKDIPNEPITGFMAMAGKLYTHELMVIGRAVNGWTKTWLPSELKDKGNICQFINGVVESVTDPVQCPMRWVSDSWQNNDHGYNTRRSAFWRCIRSAVGVLSIADIQNPEWPSHLVWSNLYKIAPRGGGRQSVRNSLLSSI